MASKKRFYGPEKNKLKYGKNGRALCRYCETEVKPPKRTFCSAECVHQWSLRKSSSYVRACLFKRDKGICGMCGLDTHRLRQSGRKMRYIQYKEFAKSLGMPYKRSTWFDADHIIPVVEGGGQCDLSNYRTLCIPCHKIVTKQLASRLAQKRKFNKNKKSIQLPPPKNEDPALYAAWQSGHLAIAQYNQHRNKNKHK